MTSTINQYAAKIYSEHPIALWPLDDPVYYISLIDDSDRLFSNWIQANNESPQTWTADDSPSIPDTPAPFPNSVFSAVIGDDPGASLEIVYANRLSDRMVYTTRLPHPLAVGDQVTIVNAEPVEFNVTLKSVIQVIDSNNFSVPLEPEDVTSVVESTQEVTLSLAYSVTAQVEAELTTNTAIEATPEASGSATYVGSASLIGNSTVVDSSEATAGITLDAQFSSIVNTLIDDFGAVQSSESTEEVTPLWSFGISLKQYVEGGTLFHSVIISAASPQTFDYTMVNPSDSTFTINAFLYGNPTYVDWYKIGYQYLDSGLNTNLVLSDEIPPQQATSWMNLNATFPLPSSLSGGVRIVIQISVNSGSAGDTNARTFIMNGLSVGQGSSLYCYDSLGSTAIDLPSELGFPTTTGISSDQYGMLADNGYYIVRNNAILSSNGIMPMIYGTNNGTRVISSGTNIPSYIFPGKGMLHENGRNKEFTFEMWMKIDPQTFVAKRIFGPLDSTDGVYVKEGFITLVIGDSIGSHYVGEWYRPMLVHVILKESNAILMINGEEVINIAYPRSTVALSSGRDWWGIYSYTSTKFFAIDCIAIYPYVVSEVVAKRRFVYGQGTESAQTLDAAYSGTPTVIDFPTAEYGANVIYPDAYRWDAGYFNNLDATRDYISVPNYSLPNINLGGRDVQEWYKDNFTVNNIEYPDGNHPNFVTFRPNYTSAEEILSSAVFWIDAGKTTNEQTITNLGYGGSVLNAINGGTTGVTVNDAKLLKPESIGYVYFPGLTGNYMSVPDSPELDITGDIDMRARIAPDDWTPSPQNFRIISKWDGASQNSYLFSIAQPTGYLRMSWSPTGSTSSLSAETTVAPTISDGSPLWVRATLDVDNGAGGYDAKFYTSVDGITWTQLGSTITGVGTTSIFSSNRPVEFGALVSGTAYSAGKFYRTQIFNGINGTKVLDIDCDSIASGSERSFKALTGQTVSILRAATGRKSVAMPSTAIKKKEDGYVRLTGVSGNYMYLSNSPELNLTGDLDIRVKVALDDWTPSPDGQQLLAKNDGWNTNMSYRFVVATASPNGLMLDLSLNGTTRLTYTSTVGTGITDGEVKWVRATRNKNAGEIKFYTSDDGVTWTQLGATITGATTGDLYVSNTNLGFGANGGTGNLASKGKFYRAIIYSDLNETNKVLDIDCNKASSSFKAGYSSSFVAETGQAVNLVSTAGSEMSVNKELWGSGQACFLFGADDYLSVADNDLLDMNASQSFTMFAVARQWHYPAFQSLITKRSTTAPDTGWNILSDSSGKTAPALSDGTNGSPGISGGATRFGEVGHRAVIVDRSTGTYSALSNNISVSGTVGSVGDTSNSRDMLIGRFSGTNTLYADMEGFAFAVFRRALTEEEIRIITDYYQTREIVNDIPQDKKYWYTDGINYQDSSYLNFSSLNVLNDEVTAVYGVFEPERYISSDRTLISFSNTINGDSLDIKINSDEIIYSLNGTELYSEVVTIGNEILVGISIPDASTEYGYEVSKFFSSPSSIQVYVGGNGVDTFEGKIYTIGFCNNNNYQGVSSNFYPAGSLGGGFAKPKNYELLIDHIASYTLVPEYEYEKLFLDISVASEWEEFYPLSYFASYTRDANGNSVYDLDMLQLNLGYVTVESTGWTYSDLALEFSSPDDYADLASSIYSSSYFNLKKQNSTGTTANVSNSSLQGYLTFQPLADGANNPLSTFTYTKLIDASRIIYVDDENTVPLPMKAYDTKFVFTDDTLVFPPVSQPFEDYAMVVHLNIKQRAILTNPLKINKFEITTKPYNENSSTVDQRTHIGTKFGKYIYPYVQTGSSLNNKGKKPLSISKTVAPYLYNSSKTGIGVRNEAVQGITPVSDTQIFIPVNENGSKNYLVSSLQFMVKPNFDSDSETIKLIQIEHSGGIIMYSLVKDGTDFAVLREYTKNSETVYTPISYANFYQNGRFVAAPILKNNEWTTIGMVFPNGLDFEEFKGGGITIFGGARFNNISYYLSDGLGIQTTLSTRVWQDVLDADVIGNTQWSYWSGGSWFDVYVLDITSSYVVTPADIYNAYTGTNGNVIDDGKGLQINQGQTKIITDASWSLISGKPV